MEEDTTTSNILLMSKIGAMVGLGFGSLALGTLPLMVGRYRAKKRLRQKRQVISSNHSNTSTSTSASNASSPSVDSVSATNKQVRSDILVSHRYLVHSQHLRKARLCANRNSNRHAVSSVFRVTKSRGNNRFNQGYPVEYILDTGGYPCMSIKYICAIYRSFFNSAISNS